MERAQYKVALLWAGDLDARRTVRLEETRLAGIANALREVGIARSPPYSATSSQTRCANNCWGWTG